MGLSFSIAGLTKFSATTKSLSGLANPTWKRAAFEESGLFMVTSLKSGFEKSTGPDGVVWDALSFPFRADKSGIIRIPGRQLLPMDKPLINHGELMGSLSFAMAGGKQVFIGYSNKKKSEIAQIMQEGRQNLVEFRIKGKEGPVLCDHHRERI